MPRKKSEIRIPDMNKNWHYSSGVDYDYDTYSNCEAEGCDGICRCSRLTNLRVTHVNINYFADSVSNNMNLNQKDPQHLILRYCVDRILRLHKAYESSVWNVDVCSSYYGEEVCGVSLDSDLANNLKREFKKLLIAKNPIEFVLKQEYDHLLPELENENWELRKVPFKNLHLGAIRHMQKINRKESKIYENYIGALAVCLPAEDEPDHYRVIDGYHRVTAMKRHHPKTRTATIVVPK